MKIYKCLTIDNCLIRNEVIKLKVKSNIELMKSIRGSWHGINPVTKVIKDKTKYTRKIKHKGSVLNEN